MSARSARQVAGHARVQRDQIITAMGKLNDARLDELSRRGQYVSGCDGFPAQTMGGGTARGSNVLTSVESAVYRRIGVPDTVEQGGDTDDRFNQVDPVAGVLNDLFTVLQQMSTLSARLLRLEENLRVDRERSSGRVSSLAGDCLACDRAVSGSDGDRLRGGLCQACDRALRRAMMRGTVPRDAAGMVDRSAWFELRRADLRDMPAESRAGERSAVTGGFVSGEGEWTA